MQRTYTLDTLEWSKKRSEIADSEINKNTHTP